MSYGDKLRDLGPAYANEIREQEERPMIPQPAVKAPAACWTCPRPATYVLEYGYDGLGACRRHLGAAVAFVLDDKKAVGVFTPAFYEFRKA